MFNVEIPMHFFDIYYRYVNDFISIEEACAEAEVNVETFNEWLSVMKNILKDPRENTIQAKESQISNQFITVYFRYTSGCMTLEEACIEAGVDKETFLKLSQQIEKLVTLSNEQKRANTEIPADFYELYTQLVAGKLTVKQICKLKKIDEETFRKWEEILRKSFTFTSTKGMRL